MKLVVAIAGFLTLALVVQIAAPQPVSRVAFPLVALVFLAGSVMFAPSFRSPWPPIAAAIVLILIGTTMYLLPRMPDLASDVLGPLLAGGTVGAIALITNEVTSGSSRAAKREQSSLPTASSKDG